MPNVKISQLPAVTVPLAGTEELPVVQGGVTKRTAINNILNANTIPYIANGLGAVATPSYTFTGDLNTGMWSPAPDTIAFSGGGAEAMRITSAGNVGIGTTAPAVKLEVSSAFDVSALNPDPTEVRISTTTISSSYPTNKPWGRLSFYSFDLSDAGPKVQGAIDAISSVANGGRMAMVFSSVESGGALIERMRITDDGDVGIGTTGDDFSRTWRLVARHDKNAITEMGVINGTVGTAATAQFSKITGTGNSFVDWSLADGNGSPYDLFNYGSAVQYVSWAFGGSERMRINSAGNVGIGTSSPGSGTLLNVAGRGLFTTGSYDPSDSTASGVSISYDTGSNVGIIGAIQAGVTEREMRMRGNTLTFFTNGANERLRITSTGGITSSDLADAVGYKGLPQNAKTASYTLALSDMGKHISITTGGVVIPANGSVAFPIGSTIVIYNDSASTQNITITTDTLRLAGTATTGTRTLAQRGLATCVKVLATEWVVSGNVT